MSVAAPGEEVAELRATAEEAARRGARVLNERRDLHRTIELKGGINLVTDADRASEDVILQLIRERHPTHTVLSEEAGLSPGTQMRWLVDPLDGTTNYAHGIPHYCVSIAVEGPSGLLAGVVLDPVRDDLFSAGRGQGATLNGRPLHASPATTLERAVVCTGFPYDVREKPEAPLALFNRIIRRVQGVRRMGAAALDLAYVASGRFDGFFEFGLKPWDIAAGALLIWEAGGVMTQVDGAPLNLAIGDVLASCPGLAADLGAECRKFVEEIGWRPGSSSR